MATTTALNRRPEAERRKLPNLKSMVDAVPAMSSDEGRELLTKYGILTEREVESRVDILLEAYIKAINIEAQLAEQIAGTIILPAALKYQAAIASTLVQTKQALGVLELVPARRRAWRLCGSLRGRVVAGKRDVNDLRAENVARHPHRGPQCG